MTAPIAQQTVSVKDVTAARKRRRRTPAGGASDDCFTCSKRNIKCDRRRPYCSQCLEIGNECSGYKTQLTWGVGVASRGKLRGLSLPIAKSPPVSREPKKTPTGRARAHSTVPVMSGHWTEHEELRGSHCGPIDIPTASHVAALATSSPYPGPGYDYLSMSHPETSASLPQGHWGHVQYSSDMMHSPGETPKYSKFPVPLMTDSLSSSVDSVSDVDYLSPLSQSYPREEMPFGGGNPTVMYDGYPAGQSSPAPQSPPSALVLDYSRAQTSCPGLIYAPSEPSSSLTSHLDHFEPHLGHRLMRDCDGLSVPQVDAYGPCSKPAGQIWTPSPSGREDELPSPRAGQHAPAQWAAFRGPESLRGSQDIIARMPFFMDYYRNTMAPSLVYIDGPHNPFRGHVLGLAVNSQSLQHAICALSACNLRMKRKLSLGQDPQELWEKLTADGSGDCEPDDPSLAEEFHHRNLAVQLLNEQLNDAEKSMHDSVLATILLLCHYRMVESGVAKFHTQFAGVKKILSMRSERFGPSRDSAWIETLFTYFDAISASINDREAQLTPEPEDHAALPPGAENMVGCERGLFRTMRKLGRLNLLSQHRPVQNMTASARRSPEAPSGGNPGSPFDPLGDGRMHSLGPGDIYQAPSHRFDGNGFRTTLDDDEILASAMCTSTALDDRRALFWREWKEARLALQNWQFDAAAVAGSLPGSPSPGQVRDLGSLSEAFRYAALLYTERLAGPNMPSSHTNFQNLVSQVVYYATSLEAGSAAEKFLLWPLFVAGSECVNELQQNIVRTKCRDIMSRSGYMNNLSALSVLEKLWAGDLQDRLETQGQQQGGKTTGHRAPFNWAKCFGGPGVEAEWIMF
ncbi:fungal specific transcription factor [Hirsutella rhossiliensis]|uniref:Fungal specific transcription factor domain-containing protein n=1 Tax=Hirsutella rhossiliensis TaxID=111463 RepID=A0A9P8N1M7_9HYPO|nr:fungal specific transcription factor domain-containing protein [Hirsutella rhossiliensis]KAH0965245.1 fungal specific transcription factor domain-containing protein [Hirsutella rhossiliensis]